MATYSVEPCDLILALAEVRHYFPGLKFDEAKMQAICLVDWAIQNSDGCDPKKLLADSNRVHERRDEA